MPPEPSSPTEGSSAPGGASSAPPISVDKTPILDGQTAIWNDKSGISDDKMAILDGQAVVLDELQVGKVELSPHPAMHTRPLEELQARVNVFVSDDLLALSMTHPSAVGEGLERTLKSNQRLEFLGDSLVGAVCAEYFFRTEPESPEGILTNRKISAVRKDALASAAKRLGLGGFLSFGRGEDVAGGRERHSNLSDAFEALIAAIFLSNDWNITRDWILQALEPELTKDPTTLVPAKNRLQERTQAMGLGIPRYVTTQAHPKAQWFFAKVFLVDDLRGEGEGKSKKLAEENAAAKALLWLEENEVLEG